MRAAAALALLALLAGCGKTSPTCGGLGNPPPPRIDAPVLVALAGAPFRVTGEHFFSTPGALRLADGRKLAISRWEDDAIEAALPAGAKSGGLAVEVSGGTVIVPLEVYEYDFFPIPPTPGTNASPLAVAVDAQGRVWINEEFHKGEIHFFDPATQKVVALPVPGAPEPGIHATTIFGDHRTTMTACGEDIVVAPDGVVWWTEGGGYLYEGRHPNHSRVVAYDPASKTFRAFNVPGDQNEIIGIAWDGKRNVFWIAQGGLKAGAKIWSLDPAAATSDLTFDFSKEPDGKGFRSWDLPLKDEQPAHLAVAADGGIWYSAFWRNRVGRLDPEKGTFREFELPPGIGTSKPGKLVGGGPWTMLVAADGTVAFCEGFDSQITRLNPADGTFTSLAVPGADLASDLTHSAAFDPSGRIWFTVHGTEKGGDTASLGFVSADGKSIVRLPPFTNAAAGLAIDPKTGDIWFAEYWRHRLGRLRKR